MPSVAYTVEPELRPEEFIDVLTRSSLSERRPVADIERIDSMLRNADVIVCARDEQGKLIGVSRAITDWSFCTYLSDLAVDAAFQGLGIGKELLMRTHDISGRKTTLILLAAPKAESYYPHIGLTKHGSCWIVERER